MDTFIQYEGPLKVRTSTIGRISGRPSTTNIETFSTKKLRDMYEGLQKRFSKNVSENPRTKPLDFTANTDALNYASEQNQLMQRIYGRPLFKDLQYFSQQTGLPLPATTIGDFNQIVASGNYTFPG